MQVDGKFNSRSRYKSLWAGHKPQCIMGVLVAARSSMFVVHSLNMSNYEKQGQVATLTFIDPYAFAWSLFWVESMEVT